MTNKVPPGSRSVPSLPNTIEWPRWMHDALSDQPEASAPIEIPREIEPEAVDHSRMRVLSRVTPRS